MKPLPAPVIDPARDEQVAEIMRWLHEGDVEGHTKVWRAGGALIITPKHVRRSRLTGEWKG